MSIGINAENLATEGLALDISGGSGDIRIVLGQSGGVTGRYEQDAGRIGLREISAHQLSLQTLVLPIADGTLRVDPPTILAELSVDAELGGGHPFTGRVSLANAGMHVSFERGPLVARARLGLRGTRYERSELAGQRAEIESVEVEALRLQLQDGTSVQVEQLSLRGVVCVVEPGGALSLRCGSARAGSLLLEQGGRVLRLRGVAWPHGLELQGEALRWPELTLDRLQLAAELPARPTRPASAPEPRGERPALDLPVLDHLDGLLSLDLFVDIRIPILPDRQATHAIRLPISQGTINFKQLEGCLSRLEDALLDFEVNERGLILELDPIPGVTFDNVTLVTWPLAGPEHDLARKQQRVRLRRLLDYQLSPKLTGSSEPQRAPRAEGPSALRRLHAADIATVLKLGGPVVQQVPGLGALRLGSPGQPALGELKLSGQLEHSPGKPPSASELRLDARDVSLGASLALAGGRAEIERLTIRQIDGARLGLHGLEPRSVSADAAGLHLGRVELRGWFGRGASA